MLENILRSLQLNPKEAHIFLKLLELGPQPASHVARITEMPRNTVRSILDNLVKKGLMVKTTRANTQYYATEKKDNIVRALKYRKLRLQEEIDRQVALLEDYGEELSSRNWATNRPKITFYEGWSGLEKVYEDSLSASECLKSWASYDALMDMHSEYFQSYFHRRAKKSIPMRSIHPDTPLAREQQKKDKTELRESALVPSERFSWQPEIQVYDDKVNISSWKDKLGIIIQSKEIAEALEMIFDLSYEAARAYGMTTELPAGSRRVFEKERSAGKKTNSK